MFKLFSRHWSLVSSACLAVEAGLLVAAVSIAFRLRFSVAAESLFSPEEFMVRAGTFAAAVLLSLYACGLYDFQEPMDARRQGILLLRALSIAVPSLWGVYYIFPGVWTGRGVFAISIAFAAAFLSIWRLLLDWILKRKLFTERVLIVGSDLAAQYLAREILEREHLGYHVVGFVDDRPDLQGVSLVNPRVIGTTADTLRLAREHQATRVVVAQQDNRGRISLDSLLECKTSGIPVERSSDYYERLTGKIELEGMRVKSWLIFSTGFVVSQSTLVLKRLLDLAVASASLLVAAPIMLLAAVAIPLDSRGPVLFRQERVGRGGRLFTLWKFRSMADGADFGDEALWAQEDDPRVTRVGRWLRRMRIDELPQLWSVLVGDMSLVGPRPEQKPFVDQLTEIFPLYPQRLVVRPGITGWAQIKAPYASSIEESEEKLRYDLYYIKNLSVFLDFSILLSTIRIVLFGRGAR